MSVPTVFIVDDDPDLRDSLTTLVRVLGHPTRSCSSAEEFLRTYDPDEPGCLILDIHMPGQSGLDLYRKLLQDGVKIPVIFITAHADVSTAVAAMKTGAIEFLEKPFDRQTLLQRIETAMELDQQWRAGERRYAEMDERVQQLSATDRETLEKVLSGVPNKAMAAELHITERAVELRRQRLMQKLGVRSVAELLDLTITHRVLAELREVARNSPIRGR